MVVVASLTGLLRMLLIILGVIFLLRLLAQFISNKNYAAEQERIAAEHKKLEKEKRRKEKEAGKTNVLGNDNSNNDIEDVDFEELD